MISHLPNLGHRQALSLLSRLRCEDRHLFGRRATGSSGVGKSQRFESVSATAGRVPRATNFNCGSTFSTIWHRTILQNPFRPAVIFKCRLVRYYNSPFLLEGVNVPLLHGAYRTLPAEKAACGTISENGVFYTAPARVRRRRHRARKVFPSELSDGRTC